MASSVDLISQADRISAVNFSFVSWFELGIYLNMTISDIFFEEGNEIWIFQQYAEKKEKAN